MAGKTKKVRLPTPLKRVEWLGSSKKDLLRFPDEVQHDIGFALTVAQFGGKHDWVKPNKGPKSLTGFSTTYRDSWVLRKIIPPVFR